MLRQYAKPLYLPDRSRTNLAKSEAAPLRHQGFGPDRQEPVPTGPVPAGAQPAVATLARPVIRLGASQIGRDEPRRAQSSRLAQSGAHPCRSSAKEAAQGREVVETG
jgi:hypothetical protein